MKRVFLLALGVMTAGCAQYGQLNFVAELPNKIDECSGIISYGDESIWLIEDSGNDDALYQVGFNGEMLTDFEVDGGANTDWEDLAKDPQGNVYIGDIGNNSGKRKTFKIHKLPDPRVEKGDKIPALDIEFRYPGNPDERTPDAEALFYYQDMLYLVTRNRVRPFTGVAEIYRVPAEPGVYTAEYVSSIKTCEARRQCQVTGAALSADGNILVLLGYGKLWVFREPGDFKQLQPKLEQIELGANTQLESICFLNNNTLLLADEERAGAGGNLYRYPLD